VVDLRLITIIKLQISCHNNTDKLIPSGNARQKLYQLIVNSPAISCACAHPEANQRARKLDADFRTDSEICCEGDLMWPLIRQGLNPRLTSAMQLS